MKLSSQEEYGLRCLLHIGRQRDGDSLTIPEIARAEGISEAYVAKLLRILRQNGFVSSVRGQAGGYILSRSSEAMVISHVLAALGGRIFESDFCERHAGDALLCTHSVDCSIRSLWKSVQSSVDQVLSQITLKDLLSNEEEMSSVVHGKANLVSLPTL